MIKSDQWVISCLSALIIIHAAVWAIGYFTNKLSYLFSFLNAASAILLTGYWAINEMSISQHIIEKREIIVLGFEVIVAMCSIYLIFSHPDYKWLKIVQYIIFGIHLTVLIAGLIFMLTFKINKLF